MRFLLLPGPPKTATTHIQQFLADNAEKFDLLGWLWPPCPDSEGYASSKGFQKLLYALDGEKCEGAECVQQGKEDHCISKYRNKSPTHIKNFYNNFFKEAYKKKKNVVIASEYLGGIMQRPNVFNSYREILPFDGKLVSSDKQHGLEIVVTVRYPRFSHVKSLYGQMIKNGKFIGNFRKWLCQEFHSKKSGVIIHPLGLARRYAEEGINVTLIDTGGVDSNGLDVADVVACEVMGVPCEEGKVKGISKERARQNVAKTHTDISTDPDYDKVTSILEAMDCNSYEFFMNSYKENTKILHRLELFKNDCNGVTPLSKAEAYAQLGNYGCGFEEGNDVSLDYASDSLDGGTKFQKFDGESADHKNYVDSETTKTNVSDKHLSLVDREFPVKTNPTLTICVLFILLIQMLRLTCRKRMGRKTL